MHCVEGFQSQTELGKWKNRRENQEWISQKADICTVTVNIASLPAISTPCGYSKNGMPIGMSIVGKQFDEATILQVADAFEKQFSTIAPSL